MLKTESAGGVIINPEKEIVLVRNGSGAPWWGFPKGHMEEGEDALMAAKREIHEECGLKDIQLVRDLGSYDRYKGGPGGSDDLSELKTIHMFLFTAKNQPVIPIDPGNPEARWIPIDEVEAMLTHPKDKAFFHSVETSLK